MVSNGVNTGEKIIPLMAYCYSVECVSCTFCSSSVS